jgi:autotransporter-associated beta strand protein
VVDKGILYFDRTNSLTVSNVISGSGAVVQYGSGATTLTGASTYTGATAISAGTLLVNGSIASSTTTVNSGGTLGGDGTVGAVKAVSGGTVLPGSSTAGGLLKTGNFSLASGAKLSLELGGTTGGGTSATLYGEVSVTGTVTLGGAAQISLFGGFTPAVNDVFYVILNNGSGAVSGTFSNAPGNLITSGGVEYQVNYAATGYGSAVANDVSLTVLSVPEGESINGADLAVSDPIISIHESVPEPGSWTLLLCGFALAGGFKRHRRTCSA